MIWDILGWFDQLWEWAKIVLFYDWFSFAGKVLMIANTLLFFSLLLPGPEPERTLFRVVSWLSRFSRKPPLPPETQNNEDTHNPT